MPEKKFILCQQLVESTVLCPPNLCRGNFQDSSHSVSPQQFIAFVQMHFMGMAVNASSDADDGRGTWGIHELISQLRHPQPPVVA